MLEHGHNHFLMAAAFAVALMSGFTGLSLTRGASKMATGHRKLVVTLSALSLGSGIWSMHFVAMLGMTLPVQFYYDALITLISALVAILLTGIALLLVHFGARTPRRITLAGLCVGIGIVAMHYIGMSGIKGVRPDYSMAGIAIAVVSSLILCVASFWVCYGKRESRNIVIGTLGFGVSAFSVHFIAMAGTQFIAQAGVREPGFWLDNEIMGLGVTLSAFVICGAFLLVGVTFSEDPKTGAQPSASPAHGPTGASDAFLPAPATALAPPYAEQSIRKLPFEKHGLIHFVPEEEVFAVRAEGRYTSLFHASGRLFCPWSISEIEERVSPENLLKCHRSYLVNLGFVTRFERRKDNGLCYFKEGAALAEAPVSRSYMKTVRNRLGV
ncbi:NO-binding membrane sensor protein with MHYT domain [Roseinatronobacter thiooxidans]|uniref:NO-binding membrane sensor protein with MHYT domain n=2 Tax=Roseinatronobacter thiooxidans TaxID=121821 RepID=A0A2W7Q7S3_9RHOB|nr:MHYT domain-containing protein [Roseinatronobacter thiooxidans]PZX37019.1 NO-binding membrane sensor protein with MHYT domain [Roseinatronobacter thiooxidans]